MNLQQWSFSKYFPVNLAKGELMMKKLTFLVVMVAMLVPSMASAVFVDASLTGDQWIWLTTPDTARTGDAMSVRQLGSAVRGSIASWDVLAIGGFTGADLFSAALILNLRSSFTVHQTSAIIDLSAGSQAIDAITWNGYFADHNGSEIDTNTSLGRILTPTACAPTSARTASSFPARGPRTRVNSP